MINPAELKHVFFIGIGGIGMSAIARYFNMKGVKVAGYDKTETQLTKTLVNEGIEIHYEDNIDLIPFTPDVVVYTPAVPASHKQLNWCKEQGFPVMKRSQILGIISTYNNTVAVAGTHGKTTTSCMIAHLLKHTGRDISAFLGGIMTGYNTNYFLGKDEWIVVEADEYDRSFMHLTPSVTILNSMDADHLDIYGDDRSIKEGFKLFIHKTKVGGTILMQNDLRNQFSKEEIDALTSEYSLQFFGFTQDCDVVAENVRSEDGRIHFDYKDSEVEFKDLNMKMPGMHNVMNACAAIAACRVVGTDEQKIKDALASFEGIKRRFEFIYEGKLVYIDDYAHHPTELKSAIEAARSMFAGKRILAIFQPHLYSRTRDFVDGFAEELDKCDEVILMDIYPAREVAIEGVTSAMILDRMCNEHKALMTRKEIYDRVKQGGFDVLMTLGAGDIDLLVDDLKEICKQIDG